MCYILPSVPLGSFRHAPEPAGPATAGRSVTERPAVAGPTGYHWVRLVMCYILPSAPLGSFRAGRRVRSGNGLGGHWVRSGKPRVPRVADGFGTEAVQTGAGFVRGVPAAPVATAQGPQSPTGFVSSRARIGFVSSNRPPGGRWVRSGKTARAGGPPTKDHSRGRWVRSGRKGPGGRVMRRARPPGLGSFRQNGPGRPTRDSRPTGLRDEASRRPRPGGGGIVHEDRVAKDRGPRRARCHRRARRSILHHRAATGPRPAIPAVGPGGGSPQTST
jgi:hypothetical protein